MFPPPPPGYNAMYDPPVPKTSIRDIIGLGTNTKQEHYSAMSPQDVLATIKQAHSSHPGTMERVALFARAFEGFNLFNKTKYLQIRNSVNKDIVIPSLQFDESQTTTLQVAYWYHNDLRSEYSYQHNRRFENHLGLLEGQPLEFGVDLSFITKERIMWLIFGVLLIFSIWATAQGVSNVLMFTLGLTLLTLLFTVALIKGIFSMVDFDDSNDENTVSPHQYYESHIRVQNEMEHHIQQTISAYAELMPHYFSDQRVNNPHDFAKFMLKYLYRPAYDELVFALSPEGTLSNSASICKEVFEDYLMIYRFLRERSLSEPGSIPDMETLAQKLSTSYVYGLFEGNESLYEYLVSLTDYAKTQVINQSSAFSATSPNRPLFLRNMCGDGFINSTRESIRRVISVLQNDQSNPCVQRIPNIKKVFSIQ